MPLAPTAPCPCGRQGPDKKPLAYSACCRRWHEGEAAPDAEALMRSRYSAYVLQLTDHLLATWHPSTRPARIEPDPPGLNLNPAVTPPPAALAVASVVR